MRGVGNPISISYLVRFAAGCTLKLQPGAIFGTVQGQWMRFHVKYSMAMLNLWEG